MNCFEIIKTVLDEAYVAIPGLDSDKDQEINERLKKFRKEYRGLTADRTIDYQDPVSRFAYVYAYVTSHANMVADLIGRSPDIRNLLNQQRVTVSCIGGGPGSDIVGIIKHLKQARLQPRLSCFLVDKNKTWNEAWCDLDSKLDADFRLYTNFMEIADTTMIKTKQRLIGGEIKNVTIQKLRSK